MASHYLEIIDEDGEQILGESEGHEYEDWIDVQSWSWGVSEKSGDKSDDPKSAPKGGSKAAAGAGAETGVETQKFQFTKGVDASTTRLMRKMDDGKVLKMATFTLFEETVDMGSERRKVFRLHAVLEKPRIVEYSLQANAGELAVELTETWTLEYSKVTFLYETERMSAEFDYRPGSDKAAVGKREPTFLEQLRKYGIQPDRQSLGRGKRE